MSHKQSAWNPDWDQYIKNLNHYIKGLGGSTGRFGGEESLHCHACGTWIETTHRISCPSERPSVTIPKRGLITLNRVAYDLPKRPKQIEIPLSST